MLSVVVNALAFAPAVPAASVGYRTSAVSMMAKKGYKLPVRQPPHQLPTGAGA